MANKSTITISAKRFHTDKLSRVLAILHDDRIRVGVNTRIKDAINQFVPKKSGALRKSARVTMNAITWGEGLPYARYQYRGQVYSPNIPITGGGKIIGWYSPRGQKKFPTKRKLGVPHYWMGWKFGYTTPHTHNAWAHYFRGKVKDRTYHDIYIYIAKACIKKGLRITK